MRLHTDDGWKSEFDFAGQQRRHQCAGSLVRNMRQLRPRHLVEQHHRQVARGAGAVRTEIKPAAGFLR